MSGKASSVPELPGCEGGGGDRLMGNSMGKRGGERAVHHIFGECTACTWATLRPPFALQASLTEAHCIPNDIIMGDALAPGTPRFLLVTGPNMGGKSTVLRQVRSARVKSQRARRYTD